MTIVRPVLVAICLPLLSRGLSAQTCMGGATFAHRRAQLNTAYASGGGVHTAAVTGASLGATPGPFLSLGLGFTNNDDLRADATVVDGTAGLGFPVLSTPETELCPFASFATLNGEYQTGEGVSAFSYGAGVGLGTRLSPRSGFELVPFVSGGYFLSSSTTHLGQNEGTAEDNYFNASFGVGFVFQDVFTIRPSASYAMAHGQKLTTYGLSISYSFGTVIARPRAAVGEGSTASVWVNPREMLYYCSGSRWYGGTTEGSFMSEREALAAGYNPERGKRC